MMGVVQIPNLPAAIQLTGNELIELVQGGVSVRAPVQYIANLSGNTYVIVTPTYVTKYQLFTALPLYNPGSGYLDANLLIQALNPDMNIASTAQYYTSAFVDIMSPLALLCQYTYGLTDLQMSNLFLLSYQQSMWG